MSYAPVNLSGPGWSATLTRFGDVVTAVVTVPPGAPDPTGVAIPADFQPQAAEVIAVSPNFPANPYVQILAQNVSVGGKFSTSASAALTAQVVMTLQWLAATTAPGDFLDIEAALVPLVQAAFPAARVLTSTPNDLEAQLPMIKLVHTGGSGDWQGMNNFGIEVDVFHSTDALASPVAWNVYHWLMQQLPNVLGKVGVRRVDDNTLPLQTSYANPDVIRYSFGVTIHIHDRRI